MYNTAIRKAMRDRKIRQWEVAEHLGISESLMSKWMRRPVDPEREREILNAIDAVAEKKILEKHHAMSQREEYVIEK